VYTMTRSPDQPTAIVSSHCSPVSANSSRARTDIRHWCSGGGAGTALRMTRPGDQRTCGRTRCRSRVSGRRQSNVQSSQLISEVRVDSTYLRFEVRPDPWVPLEVSDLDGQDAFHVRRTPINQVNEHCISEAWAISRRQRTGVEAAEADANNLLTRSSTGAISLSRRRSSSSMSSGAS
jgi:hypothetical protein